MQVKEAMEQDKRMEADHRKGMVWECRWRYKRHTGELKGVKEDGATAAQKQSNRSARA